MSNKKPSSNDIHIYRSSDIFSYMINRYIETYDDYIVNDGFGKYIFVKSMSENNINIAFSSFFDELITSNKFDLGTRKTIIVSGGYPFMNWRMSQFNEVVSNSSKTILKNQMFLNYVLTDRQVKIDESFLNLMLNSWFLRFMSSPKDLAKLISKYDNLYMFCNKRVSEDDLISVITEMFGVSRIDVKSIDQFKSMCELSKHVYKDIEPMDIPDVILDECIQYIKMMFNGELPDNGVNGSDDGEEW